MKEKILALDTSSRILALALAQGDEIVWEENHSQQFRHIELLVPLVQEGLQSCGWRMSDITVAACGIGPGSFTGLRVGLAAVKALGLAQRLKVVTLSSLDIIAHNARERGDCAVIVDARRDSVYYAGYTVSSRGVRKRNQDKVLSLRQLKSRLKRRKKRLTVCGDGWGAYGTELAKKCGDIFQPLSRDMWFPRGRSIVACAQPPLSRKEYTPLPQVLPRYLRLSRAEEVRARQRKKARRR